METKDWILLSLSFAPLILVFLYSYNYEVFYFLYNYSGVRAIVEKIHPPIEGAKDDYRRPSTFMLWAVSIYVALFSIASARYDRAVNSYEMQITAWQAQMATEYRGEACANVKNLQSSKTPLKPNITKPWTTLASFFTNEIHIEGKDLIRNTICAYRQSLRNAVLKNSNLARLNLHKSNFSNANLVGADFSNTNLENSNFKDSILCSANLFNVTITDSELSGSNLIKANLKRAYIRHTNATKTTLEYANLQQSDLLGSNFNFSNFDNSDLSHANISMANMTASSFYKSNLRQVLAIETQFKQSRLKKACLTNATLDGANFNKANLVQTNFTNATLTYANFSGANLENSDFTNTDLLGTCFHDSYLVCTNLASSKRLTAKQLYTVNTLYKAKLPKKIKKELRKAYPHLFEKPIWYHEPKN
ncbi:pentapeptide repeat-containing protein [Maridesulfovibrio sp.]|uniref:pentapeptide repeat-containing protein n=1 Tax=Maridesulfovibrio sp. TaxID=2795000 RepID=UPI0029CA44FE|nr:pentapeptide repeat-containing protein [Maridesulfovibrio sp.]